MPSTTIEALSGDLGSELMLRTSDATLRFWLASKGVNRAQEAPYTRMRFKLSDKAGSGWCAVSHGWVVAKLAASCVTAMLSSDVSSLQSSYSASSCAENPIERHSVRWRDYRRNATCAAFRS